MFKKVTCSPVRLQQTGHGGSVPYFCIQICIQNVKSYFVRSGAVCSTGKFNGVGALVVMVQGWAERAYLDVSHIGVRF